MSRLTPWFLAIALLPALAGCSDLGEPLRLAPECDLSAAMLAFGQVATNDSVHRTLTIRNPGSAPLSGNVTLSCPAFTVIAGGGSFTLAPDGSRTLTVRFLPSAAGTYSCTLNLGTGCTAVALSGVAEDPTPAVLCELAPLSIDFGAIDTGTTLTRTFVVRSRGTASLVADINSPCPEFQVIANGGAHTIPPGDSLVISVRFQPTTAGTHNCSIDLGTGCSDLPVSGTATTPIPAVSFASDIQPIFTARACISCHSGPAASGGMDLSPGVAYGNLVNAVSFGYAPAVRVKPLEPINSVLYGKLSNSGQFGSEMPPGSVIPAAEREKVRQWILAGAPNN